MGLIAAVVANRWQPGIGDPTVLGWGTVVAYAVSFVLCVLACRKARGTTTRRTASLWAILAAMMLLLGINKQLDLQTWFSQVARDQIMNRGLYDQRRAYQGAFILAASLVGLTTVGGLGFVAIRRRWPLLPVAGATFLISYVIIRAASFHHVDHIINMSIPGARLSSVIELFGIATIGFAAVRALKPSRISPDPGASIDRGRGQVSLTRLAVVAAGRVAPFMRRSSNVFDQS